MQLKSHPPTSTLSPPPLTTESSILIIGAGTWGSSTALHLARRGYADITVLDLATVPSPIAAGNDINKILMFTSSSDIPALADAARTGWREDPVFQGLFHETGAIECASSPEVKKTLDEEYAQTPSDDEWKRIEGTEEFRKLMPPGVLTGNFPGWVGWAKGPNHGCGWVEARHALTRAALEAKRLGVKFVTGERGRVTSLIYEEGDVKGAVVAYGEAFRAERTILCAGANAAEVMDMMGQLRPTAWTLAHIKMTDEERRLYKELPVLFNVERGFFMEPDKEKGELKICDEHPGYCNWETTPDQEDPKSRSVPFAPFSFARICWCADTPDRTFLISRHPEFASLVLGVGGSGHGFSFIPAIGGVIADCLEGNMDKQMEKQYRWRPETAVGRDWTDKQDRFGPEGSNHVMDFQQVKEWTNIKSC